MSSIERSSDRTGQLLSSLTCLFRYFLLFTAVILRKTSPGHSTNTLSYEPKPGIQRKVNCTPSGKTTTYLLVSSFYHTGVGASRYVPEKCFSDFAVKKVPPCVLVQVGS